MFSWASNRLEQLVQTVAPPPQDATARFLYLVQRDDEGGAQGCLAEFSDPFHAVVQPTKGTYPLHLACQHGMERLLQQLLSMPGAHIQVPDNMGNSPLHYACMNTNTNTALNTVKLLVTQYSASAVTRNAANQTPYDVATLNSVRQYLLPLQLQQETQNAIDNGGLGLTPGIDLGGMQIKNSHLPPPPIGGMIMQSGAPPPKGHVPPPMPNMGSATASATASATTNSGPPTPSNGTPTHHHGAGNGHFTTPSPSMPPPPQATAAPPTAAPVSGGQHAYSRTGHSSLAIGNNSKYRPDGFHSSSSDVNLQRKYGNVSVAGAAAVPPPPSSGNSSVGASPASGTNPYARGAPTRSRYLAHDGSSVTPPVSGGFNYYAAAGAAPANTFTMFNPAGTGIPQQQPYAQQLQGYPPHQQQPPPPSPAQPYQQQPPPPSPAQPYQEQAPPPSPAQPYQQQAPPPAQAYQQPPPAQAYQQPPPAQTYQQPASPYQQQTAAAQPATSPYQQAQHYAAPTTPSASFFPPPPTMSSVSHSPYAQQSTADAFTATPVKDFPAIPAQQPMQHYVSTGSTASAQDLFAGPSAEKSSVPASHENSAFEQPPNDAMARVGMSEEKSTATFISNAAPTDAAVNVFDSPAVAIAPSPVSTGSAADIFGAPAASVEPSPVSTGSAADIFGAPAASVELSPVSTGSAADIFGAPAAVEMEQAPASTGSAADIFGAPAVSVEPSPVSTGNATNIFGAAPAVEMEQAPASIGSVADVFGAALAVEREQATAVTEATEAGVFGAPAYTEAVPVVVESDAPTVAELKSTVEKLAAVDIMEDFMDEMQDVPLSTDDGPEEPSPVNEATTTAKDLFGLPPPPTFS